MRAGVARGSRAAAEQRLATLAAGGRTAAMCLERMTAQASQTVRRLPLNDPKLSDCGGRAQQLRKGGWGRRWWEQQL